jgi:NADPH:quinone reductase-like Zn-dependent oxidoreductase
MEVGSTYRAVQAVSRGRLELTEKTLHAPGPGKVRIRVEACGVCHSDSGTVEALFPIIGRASRAMRSSGGSMRLVPVSRAGRSVSALGLGFSAALAVIASSAATAIS